jgi:methionine synthase II (cobalamin-independent)
MPESTQKNHQRPPFRAEHLGSLLRPDKLLQARKGVDSGAIDKAKLATTEDEAIQDIVQAQLDMGYHAITDGEYRRHMFWLVLPPQLP